MDPTEGYRRARAAEINADPAPVPAAAEGDTWTTDELQRDFEVLGFAAPFVIVRRRADDAKGSLEFRHSPRVYFNWEPHR